MDPLPSDDSAPQPAAALLRSRSSGEPYLIEHKLAWDAVATGPRIP